MLARREGGSVGDGTTSAGSSLAGADSPSEPSALPRRMNMHKDWAVDSEANIETGPLKLKTRVIKC